MESTTLQQYSFDKKTLNALKLVQLKELATSLKLKIPSGLNKDDTVGLIQKHGRKLQKSLAKNNSSAEQSSAKENSKSSTTKSSVKQSTETKSSVKQSTETKSSVKQSAESNKKIKPTKNDNTNQNTKPTNEQKPKRINKSPTRSRNETAGKTTIGKYKIIKQLGTEGKEGTCYLVENRKGERYAMKCFAKSKSSNMLQKEALAQKEVAKYDLAPKIKEVNEDEKYIVMDHLDRNLFDIVKKNNGEIPDAYQKKVTSLISKLDETGIFHGDPNPANFMLKGQKMYIIDFGFAKDIDERLIKKYDTETPNKKFMPIGLILKLKEIYRNHNPNIEYKVLSKYCE